MKSYTVYLFRSPDCIRGWLSYIEPSYGNRATFKVLVNAESGPKAKNKAITAANNGFKGVEILGKNLNDKLWGINNFPDLEQWATGEEE